MKEWHLKMKNKRKWGKDGERENDSQGEGVGARDWRNRATDGISFGRKDEGERS